MEDTHDHKSGLGWGGPVLGPGVSSVPLEGLVETVSSPRADVLSGLCVREMRREIRERRIRQGFVYDCSKSENLYDKQYIKGHSLVHG